MVAAVDARRVAVRIGSLGVAEELDIAVPSI